jgi:hypothetical protein
MLPYILAHVDTAFYLGVRHHDVQKLHSMCHRVNKILSNTTHVHIHIHIHIHIHTYSVPSLTWASPLHHFRAAFKSRQYALCQALIQQYTNATSIQERGSSSKEPNAGFLLSTHNRALVARLYALLGKECAADNDLKRAAECLWRSDQLWELLEVLDLMRDEEGIRKLMDIARQEGDANLQVCVCIYIYTC